MKSDLTIKEIKKGYSKKGDFLFQCLYCDQTFDDRFVYPLNEGNSQLARAEGAMIYHIKHEHHGPFDALLRNHRFKFKEKKRQAKILLALLESIEEKDQGNFIANSIIDSDERFISTEKEREKVFKTFLDKNGKANQIPKKEKKRIILIQKLAENFTSEKQYSEKEINEIISMMFEDYVTIRRYLIEYGILGRTVDGRTYWKL
jgi:hypothetical protein